MIEVLWSLSERSRRAAPFNYSIPTAIGTYHLFFILATAQRRKAIDSVAPLRGIFLLNSSDSYRETPQKMKAAAKLTTKINVTDKANSN